jgi:hypothetical protein
VNVAVLSLGGGTISAPADAANVRVTSLVHLVLIVGMTGQLGRIPVLQAGTKDAPILLNDVALLLTLAGASLAVALRGSLRLDRLTGMVALFATVGAVSTILAIPRFGLTPFEAFFSLAYLVRWLVYFGLYLVVINFVRAEEVASVVRTFFWAVAAFAAFGIVQSAFLPDFAQIIHPTARLYLDWDPQGHRLVSTLLDPNFAGALIVMALLVATGLLLYGARVSRAGMALLAVGFALTLSRGAFVALVIGAIVLAAGRGISRRVLQISAAAALAALVLAPWVLHYGAAYNKF